MPSVSSCNNYWRRGKTMVSKLQEWLQKRSKGLSSYTNELVNQLNQEIKIGDWRLLLRMINFCTPLSTRLSQKSSDIRNYGKRSYQKFPPYSTKNKVYIVDERFWTAIDKMEVTTLLLVMKRESPSPSRFLNRNQCSGPIQGHQNQKTSSNLRTRFDK